MNEMNYRAQLSIDLLLTIFIILVFIAGFQGISSSLIASQQELSVKQQEKIILLDLKQLIESSAKQGTTLINNYEIPAIKVEGKALSVCTLTKNGNEIEISANLTENLVEKQSITLLLNSTQELEINGELICGKKINLIIKEVGA